MKTNYTLLTVFCLFFIAFLSVEIFSQDTFSIVAVDTVTGEIGSAGASCVMLQGLSPQQIIDWLVANDAGGNPTVRQYGIVDLTRNGESAAYTGVNCTNYKNHVTGPGYAIQGNILLGQVIIDTMHSTFLNTPGPLADKLMATLQAAKILGADTRCAARGTSSQSGFVKVVRIGDGATPYLKIVVPDTPIGTDPINVLQGLFDNWKIAKFNIVDPFLSTIEVDPDTIPANGTSQGVITISPKNNSDTLLASGKQVILINTGAGTLGSVIDLGDGTYEAAITSPIAEGSDTISAIVISGTDTVTIFWKAIVTYANPTSIDENKLTPHSFYLYQNSPNPFNPTTKIKYIIPNVIVSRVKQSQFVTLKVYDVLGNEVAILVNKEQEAGTYEVEFDASSLSSGTYFYKLQAGSFVDTRKMILLK
ncbi:MAG: DUF1028 domain-containing protein [Ignavibacteriaceae bacterium]|nr:DUF1028 domain-containing protein [Ignavibacteriaceae bacterium]